MDSTIISSEKDGVPHGTAIGLNAATWNNNAAYENIIKFLPHVGTGFTGAVDNVSFKDLSTLFSGGTVDSWSFTGFDSTLDNFISWDSTNQNIIFTNAPINSVPGADSFIPKLLSLASKYKSPILRSHSALLALL